MFLLKREEVKRLINQEHQIGFTNKKIVIAAILTGFLSLIGIIATFGITSTVFALPVGGMGDFYVKFEKLEGKGFSLHPHIGETSDSKEAPLIRNKIDEATIEGLHIFKEVKLPGDHWVRINITTPEPTIVKGLIQDAKLVDANLSFENMEIKQKNTSKLSAKEAFKQNWTHQANTITITDGEISTAYLFQSTVSLKGAQISVESIDGPYQGQPIPRQPIKKSPSLDDGSAGGILPKTATNYWMFISIGIAILFVSILTLFLFRRKLNAFKG